MFRAPAVFNVVMRVGELLHRNGLVAAEELASALADQRIAGKRVCTLLIVRGVIGPDEAARVLAEQHGVSAALTKHLDNRDHSLVKLLPAGIARQHCALPIGRLRDGEIVICVRDPRPGLQGAFERIVNKPVLITVAAAHAIESLVEMTYPATVSPELSVRFARPSTQPASARPATQPSPPPPQAFAAGTLRPSNRIVEDDLEIEVDDPNEVPTFSLVDLDDDGVDKDFSQHDMKTPTTLPPGFGAAPRAPTLPPANVVKKP